MELHGRCICVCVELKCYSSGASGSNRGGNSGFFGSGLLCPCNLSFMCVCVCKPVNLCIINYKFFYHLYSPVSSFFLRVKVCVCICGNDREQPWTNSMWRFRIQPGRERTRGVFFGL